MRLSPIPFQKLHIIFLYTEYNGVIPDTNKDFIIFTDTYYYKSAHVGVIFSTQGGGEGVILFFYFALFISLFFYFDLLLFLYLFISPKLIFLFICLTKIYYFIYLFVSFYFFISLSQTLPSPPPLKGFPITA